MSARKADVDTSMQSIASSTAVTHIDAVVSDAQQMVITLTNSVKNLREERKALKASLDSLGEENLALREQIMDHKKISSSESDALSLQLAHANALNTKLTERCDKLQLLVQLGELKRQEMREESTLAEKEHRQDKERMDRVQESFKRSQEQAAQQLLSLRVKQSKLEAYCQQLEKEALHQWEQRCAVISAFTELQSEHRLLGKEIFVLKALGVGSKAVGSAVVTNDQERFMLLKHELGQAADFLRHAQAVAEGKSDLI